MPCDICSDLLLNIYSHCQVAHSIDIHHSYSRTNAICNQSIKALLVTSKKKCPSLTRCLARNISSLKQLRSVRSRRWRLILDVPVRMRWEGSFISLTRRKIYVMPYISGEAVQYFQVLFSRLLNIWVTVAWRQSAAQSSRQISIKGNVYNSNTYLWADQCYSLHVAHVKPIS